MTSRAAETDADARPRSSPLGAVPAAALVFGTSFAVLVLEILSLRLLAPYLGLTLETNTAVIGIALTAIAAGAWLGGQAADRVDPVRAIGPVILAGGILYLTVVPAVRWVGEAVGDTSDIGVVLLIAAIAVFGPAALLSAVPPMVVKARLRSLADTGSVVGRLSGISTVGAIAGTFVAGFVLVAAVPTSTIVLAVAGLLVLVGAVLTALHTGRRRAGAALVLALVAATGTVNAPSDCEVETAYHCARVEDDPNRGSGRTLVLDTLRHSYVDLDDPQHLEFSYIRAMAAAIDVQAPDGEPLRAFFIGGGGVTLPRFLAAARPGSSSLVYEIDGGVVELDRRRLGLQTGADLDVRVGDARLGLAAQPAASRDVVVGDAFGGLAVPWHLTTIEVVEQVRRVLVPGGVYAVNVIDYPPLDFARAEVATIKAVFPHVSVVASPETLQGRAGGNLVVLASDRPLPKAAFSERLNERAPELDFTDGAAVTEFAGDAQILRDDHAPVDQLLTQS